jgi:hypothetical protein
VAKFRKKQVEVEAFRWGTDKQPAWFQKAVSAGKVQVEGSIAFIETLEGKMRADKGDWVVRGVQGELYPCKPDIFDQTYEPAE